MADPTVYELLAKQIEGGFERQDTRWTEMVEQLRQLNGRVTDAHIKIAVHEQQLNAGQRRIDLLGQRSHDMSNLVQQVPQLTADVRRLDQTVQTVPLSTQKAWKRQVGEFLMLIAGTTAVLKFLGMLTGKS